MKGYLKQSYGTMSGGDNSYEIFEEGRDYFLFSNGYYVPKNLVTTGEQVAKIEEMTYDYWASKN
jgi:hypothetical protein